MVALRVIAPERLGTWILTASGVAFDFVDPRAEDIDARDLAHALSNLCRFGGHAREFYSVAQHSVLVSELVPQGLALAGLLHDAAEAYLGDVVSPLKARLPGYRALEALVGRAVEVRFGLPRGALEDSEIRRADTVALLTERRDLLPKTDGPWAEDASGLLALSSSVQPERPHKARARFLERLYDLTTAPLRDTP